MARRRRKKKIRITVRPWHVGAVLLFIGMLMSLPYLRRSIRDTGATIPAIALDCSFGIDISHYQDTPSWDSLLVVIDAKGRSTRDITRAKEVRPVEFAFIKATEGESMVDCKFADNWESSAGASLRRGAYHFFRSSKDPLRQAENFIKTVGSLTAYDLPPVLDIETMHKGCSKAQLNEGIRIWLETVEAHYRRKPVIYASENWLREVIATDITSAYPTWVAHYGVESPRRKEWNIWQFTDKAVVHGVPGKIDLSCMKRDTRF